MSSEGDRLRLADLVVLVRGTTYKSALLGQPGPKLLGLGSIQRDGGFRGDSLKTYGGDSAEKLLLRPGDLYVSLKDVTQSGDLLGAIARVPANIALGRLTQDTVKLQLDASKYPPTLLYWSMRAPEYRTYCRKRAIGTTNLSLSRDDFLAYVLPAPTQERMALVELLEAIESRIDVLLQTNATLEAIAQALFKSWLIDFDPVKEKLEGRLPQGIDSATAALFPGSFEESSLGAIPMGWTATPLREVLVTSSDRVGDLAVPEYASTNQGLVLRDKLFNKQLSKSQAKNKLIRRGDLVFGLSRTTLNYGQMNDAIGSVSSAYKVFRIASEKVEPQLLGRLIMMRKDYFFNAVSASSREGQSISTSSLERLQFARPPMKLQRALSSNLEPFFDSINGHSQELATLVNLRDTLLHRLVSGKLKLSEVDCAAQTS